MYDNVTWNEFNYKKQVLIRMPLSLADAAARRLLWEQSSSDEETTIEIPLALQHIARQTGLPRVGLELELYRSILVTAQDNRLLKAHALIEAYNKPDTNEQLVRMEVEMGGCWHVEFTTVPLRNHTEMRAALEYIVNKTSEVVEEVSKEDGRYSIGEYTLQINPGKSFNPPMRLKPQMTTSISLARIEKVIRELVYQFNDMNIEELDKIVSSIPELNSDATDPHVRGLAVLITHTVLVTNQHYLLLYATKERFPLLLRTNFSTLRNSLSLEQKTAFDRILDSLSDKLSKHLKNDYLFKWSPQEQVYLNLYAHGIPEIDLLILTSRNLSEAKQHLSNSPKNREKLTRLPKSDLDFKVKQQALAEEVHNNEKIVRKRNLKIKDWFEKIIDGTDTDEILSPPADYGIDEITGYPIFELRLFSEMTLRKNRERADENLLESISHGIREYAPLLGLTEFLEN